MRRSNAAPGGGLRQEPAIDQETAVAGRCKRVDEVRSDFIAARADTRSNRNGHIPGLCAELRPIVSTATRAAPAAVPRQPACTAATAPVRESAISSGTQSAALTAIARSGLFDTSTSPSGRSGGAGSPRRTTTAWLPCTCVSVTTADDPTARRERRPAGRR